MIARLTTGVVAIAFVLGALPASAQTRPDFSGTWVVQNVDTQRPQDGNSGGGGGQRRRGGGGGGGFGRGGFGGGQRGCRSGGGFGGARGGGGGRGLLGDTYQRDDRITLKQTDDGLIVTNEAMGRMTRLTFDGKETSNPGPADSKVKSKAHWDGAALVVENTTTIEAPQNGNTGGGGQFSVEGRQIWSLTPEGMLKLESRTKGPRGNTTTTVTLARVDSKN